MRISVTDKAWVDRKIAQFQDTAAFAESLDPSQAQPDTVKSVITDLVRIVRDYCADLGREEA